MARKLDARQQGELTEFVNALAAAADYRTSTEWARESGYAYPNLTNLRNGKKAVDGYNLLRLIRAAAARVDAEPDALAVTLARPPRADATSVELRELRDELRDRDRRLEQTLSQLRDQIARLAGSSATEERR